MFVKNVHSKGQKGVRKMLVKMTPRGQLTIEEMNVHDYGL